MPEKSAEPQPEAELRTNVDPAPAGWDRFRWFGPGLLWMVASVGSGSVLFTPRVGSRYGLDLLWIAILGAVLTWVIIREIGRYTVITGKTILDGYAGVPGPRGWAVWIIFVPGLASGVIMVAGLSGLVGSALMIALPGSQLMYGLAIIIVSCVLVVSGKYQKLELVTSLMAIVLVLSAVATAAIVFPDLEQIGAGMMPTIPSDFDPYFVLPWVGFLLAGAAGVMWFSYWVAARGIGGLVEEEDEGVMAREEERHAGDSDSGRKALHSWMATMSIAAGIGIVGGTIINISFLTLGAQLLAPLGIIPEGIDVAADLARLLSEVWGATGFWFLIVGIVIALWGSVLANQDGWGRMYTDATRMLLGLSGPLKHPTESGSGTEDEADRAGEGRAAGGALSRLCRFAENRIRLKNTYIVGVLTAAPIVVFLLLRDPVNILSIGGIISAAHMPVVVFLTLYLNQVRLPKEFRPGTWWSSIMILVGLYYAFFAGFYFHDLLPRG
jgi:Mn2+/Fe2+ NRAMP family transporter